MPQATDKLRAKMYAMFESGTNDEGPIEFLQKAGYVLQLDHTWRKPGISELWEMTQDEFACLCFLVEEWDYGGLSEH